MTWGATLVKPTAKPATSSHCMVGASAVATRAPAEHSSKALISSRRSIMSPSGRNTSMPSA